MLKPLHDAAGLVRVRVATYQSVSGAGAQAMERLRNEPQAEHDLRMDWDFDGEEFDEESKLRAETRKIMELPDLPIQATCVRVPVMVGHAEAVWLETEDELTPEQARALLEAAPSVRIDEFPSPGKAAGHRRRARRPHPPRPDGRARARALPRERQPPQGRRAERDPDRGARRCAASAPPRSADPCAAGCSAGSSAASPAATGGRPPPSSAFAAEPWASTALQVRSDRPGEIEDELGIDPADARCAAFAETGLEPILEMLVPHDDSPSNA